MKNQKDNIKINLDSKLSKIVKNSKNSDVLTKLEIDKKFANLIKSSKNFETLTSFNLYCLVHKEERFWQAMTSWLGKDITVDGKDPFYWKGKTK
jgi:hypothetical protein